MNNIYDEIDPDQDEPKCNEHIWIWSDDKNSIYCYNCKLIKYIKPGTPA